MRQGFATTQGGSLTKLPEWNCLSVCDHQRPSSLFFLYSLQKVELHKAEQRWVRPTVDLTEMDEEEKETVELYRKFQGILNKLTPQKFQSLAEQALQLNICTEERLQGCIDKIFTKVQ